MSTKNPYDNTLNLPGGHQLQCCTNLFLIKGHFGFPFLPYITYKRRPWCKYWLARFPARLNGTTPVLCHKYCLYHRCENQVMQEILIKIAPIKVLISHDLAI